ncbi:HAD hydrolase, family IE [Dictyocaulus viviparus]|uniref:5'-nucleotidase n=1 Tax=Dictyocaulus viviparus TaxID=29172 RepID=A0A0D8Y9F8_DICVI|nr:HAD hydrolase, family IE [Dictyocaulus viviparus]
METEVIVLDSDDEDLPVNAQVNGSALASIAIVNAKPLDLNALGIGSISVDDGMLNNGRNENQRYYGALSTEDRSQGLISNRIKSNTSTPYSQTGTPLPQETHLSSMKLSCERTQSDSQSKNESAIDALSLLTGSPITHRSMQSRSPSVQINLWASGVLPTPLNITRQVPESRVHNYNFEVSGEKSSESDRQLCPSLKFKCQYPNCRRIVTGNVSFVCHLWAHIATWKEYDPKATTISMLEESGAACATPCKRNDVDLLSTCPSCTARFHTPYLMQVGAANALRIHLLAHESNDAPYHCKRCRYRCTVRLHLFDHFVREHKNTSTLMCPFCTFTIVVPSYQRKRPVIRVTEFVYHMISHESESRLGCDNCALSFSNLAEKQKHRREHSAVNPKWTLTYRDPETRTRPRSRLICPEQKSPYQCNKCTGTSENGSTFRKCIACVTLAFNDSVYGKRRAVTDSSVRYGIDTLQCSLRGMRFHCKCGMTTRNGDRMAQHFYYCNMDFDIIDTDDELAEPTEADEADDRMEAHLFSVLPKMGPAVTNSEVKVVERKRKLIEPPLAIFEQQVISICKQEDINNAIIFFRMAMESVLSRQNVHMRNPELVSRKLNDLIASGKNQLVVISDFDFTLTKYVDEVGSRCLSSHSVLDHLLFSMYPELEEQVEIRNRNAKYMSIEFDPKLTKHEKLPYMVEWWTAAHNDYLTFGIHRDDIKRFVANVKIQLSSISGFVLRDGARAFLQDLASASIPLLLFSAGIGNVIEIFLRHQLETVPDNVHIVSNMLSFDKEGVANSFSEPLIHVYCKDSSVIPKDNPFFDNVMHRQNVLLLGDSLGDLHMDTGMAHIGTILKIGFLNSNVDGLLDSYLDGFDIVLVQDQTVDVPDLILQALIKKD